MLSFWSPQDEILDKTIHLEEYIAILFYLAQGMDVNSPGLKYTGENFEKEARLLGEVWKFFVYGEWAE